MFFSHTYPSIFPSMDLSTSLFIYIYTYLFIHSSAYIYIYLSAFQSFYLSIHINICSVDNALTQPYANICQTDFAVSPPPSHSPWKPPTPLHLTLGSFQTKSPSEILQAAFTFPLVSKLCKGTVYPASRCLKVPRFLVWLSGECRTRVRNGPVCVKRLLVWVLYGKGVWDECRWAFCFVFHCLG